MDLTTYLIIITALGASVTVITIQLIRGRPKPPRVADREEEEELHEVVSTYVKYLRRKYGVRSEYEEVEE